MIGGPRHQWLSQRFVVRSSPEPLCRRSAKLDGFRPRCETIAPLEHDLGAKKAKGGPPLVLGTAGAGYKRMGVNAVQRSASVVVPSQHDLAREEEIRAQMLTAWLAIIGCGQTAQCSERKDTVKFAVASEEVPLTLALELAFE